MHRSAPLRALSVIAVTGLLAACGPSASAPTSQPAAQAPTKSEPAAQPSTKSEPASQPSTKPAAQAPTTPAEIYMYSGADRQQVLEEGAMKEGKILWYTTLIVNDRARPLAEAFRKKYSYITIEPIFIEQILARTSEEYKANRFEVDFFETSFVSMVGLKEAGLISRFTSPSLTGIPKEVQDPDGFFVGDRENPLGMAFNTKQVPESDTPKSFDDLLDPKWKDRLTTNDGSQGIQFFGAMLELKGEDYVRNLAQQNVTVYSLAAKAATELVISGEITATFPSSVGHVSASRKDNAPVAWTGFEKAPTALGYLAVASKAPHPYSAALFADFLISEDGQLAMSQTGEGATRTGITNAYGGHSFTKTFMDFTVPQNRYMGEFDKWTTLFKSLFVKRA
jgi:iron(III) transport system substrate-binding protein